MFKVKEITSDTNVQDQSGTEEMEGENNEVDTEIPFHERSQAHYLPNVSEQRSPSPSTLQEESGEWFSSPT